MKQLARGAIATGTGTLLYTVPQSFKCDVKDICISNTTSASVTVKIHFVPYGDAVGTANQFIPDVTIAANTIMQIGGTQSLNSRDFIQGITSASGVNVYISGEEFR
jgi:hypothetical protein